MKCKNVLYKLCMLACATTIWAQSYECPKYSGGASMNIQFYGNKASTPAIRARVKSSRGDQYSKRIPEDTRDQLALALDSGSTVLALRTYLIPDFPQDPNGLKKGFVIYTSNRFFSGYWYDVEMDLLGDGGSYMTTKVKALAVTRSCICSWWQPGWTDCLQDPVTGKVCTDNGDDFHYMGITFGYKPDNPDFSPDKNALLGITHYNGRPIDSSWRPGYIIRRSSIEIGLNKGNAEGFKCMKLDKQKGSGFDYDWVRPDFSLKFDNGAWKRGCGAIIDTGVDSVEFWSRECPSTSGSDSSLKIGTAVSVKFPNDASPMATWDFKWNGPTKGDDKGMPLTAYCGYQSLDCAGVNTGKHIFEVIDTVYDPREGYWGARGASSKSVSENGTWEQEL